MRDWARQLDMPQPFPPYLRLNHLDAAFLADNATVLHALIFATVTLPVFGWAKDFGAEKPVAFRFKGSIINGFRLLHLTVRPLAHLCWRGDANTDAIKIDRLPRFFEELQNAVQTCSSLAEHAAWRLDMPVHRSIAVAIAFDQFNIQAETLQFLHQDIERLRQAGVEDVVTFDDRLIHTGTPGDIVGLDSQHLLQGVGGAIGLESPDFHLPEPLPAELRLATEWLLCHQGVWTC